MTTETLSSIVAIGAATWPTVKYVVVPIRRALRNIEEMSKLLGSNGGSSLGDLIRATASRSKVSGARLDFLCDEYQWPILEFSPDGMNVRINDRFTTDLGYSQEDMLGNRWIVMMHPDDRPKALEQWHFALKDQRLCDSTYRCITRDGSTYRIRVITEPKFFNPGSELVRWIGRVEILERAKAAA